MGLDMYLNAKRHIGFDEVELADNITDFFPELKELKVQEVTVEAMYWRKSNAIHKWFVDNIQDGNDDCGHYWVPRGKLNELRQLLLEVLSTKDASLLRPRAGFFFGSTAVDEWYWKDLRRTAAELEKLLTELPLSWEFEYHSSW